MGAAVDVMALPDALLASAWVRAVAIGDAARVAACESEAEERGTSCTAILAATQQKPSRYDATAEKVKQNVHKHNEQRAKTGKRVNTGKGGKWDESKHERKGKGAGGGQFAKKGTGGGKGGASKADKEAEKAAKAAERAASKAWDDQEALRKAEERAKEGNFGTLVALAERREAAARKDVDLAKDDDARNAAEARLTEETTRLAEVRERAAKAKADKEAAAEKKKADTKAEREAKIAARKAESEAKAAASKAATENKKLADTAAKAKALADAEAAAALRRDEALATLRQEYGTWEADVRAQHPGLAEAQLNELILQDRMRRLRTLPTVRKAPT
jgi:hypothetical protein